MTAGEKGALRSLLHYEKTNGLPHTDAINRLFVVSFIALALLDSTYLMLVFIVLLMVTILIRRDKWFIPSKLLSPLLLIAFIGFAGSVISGLALQETHRVMRDATYHLSPVVGILVGINLKSTRSEDQGYVSSLFVASALASLVFLVVAIRNDAITQLFASDATFGQGRISTYLALYCPLCLFADKTNWPLRAAYPKTVLFVGFLGMMLCIFMQSRTILLCLVICFLCVSGTKSIRKVRFSWRAVVIASVAAAVAFFMLPDQITGYFIYKVQASLSELNFGGNNVWNDYNVVMHWRGYEGNCFFREFSSFSVLQMLFGRGFGSLMDVGGYEWLVTGESGGIPILHNGYFGILFKCGIFGLVLELVFFVRLFHVFRTMVRSNDCFELRLGVGLAICMFIVTWFDTGIFMHAGLYYLILPISFLLSNQDVQARLS